jgi:putative hydrolase of HD superfamily
LNVFVLEKPDDKRGLLSGFRNPGCCLALIRRKRHHLLMTSETSPRLDDQFSFLLEADALKSVERSNVLMDHSRPENSAEHSWHIALYALVFAPLAPTDVSISRVIMMLILHDLVEIDVGDHPVHEATDWDEVTRLETLAAARIFGKLPADQARVFQDLWSEFADRTTPDAVFAHVMDHTQPLFQTLCADTVYPGHEPITRGILTTGRGVYLKDAFPAVYAHAWHLLGDPSIVDRTPVTDRLAFLTEADKLKSVLRATKLVDGSRYENSAEHSWHIMLYAWVLAEHAHVPIQIDRVIAMLLIHDLVEIDAGDNPIHGDVDHAAQEAAEQAAADRLFALLPPAQAIELRLLWDEFEAAHSDDALFAKAVDRVQSPLHNMANGGGSWRDYDVTLDQLDSRIGVPIHAGAPAAWTWVRAQIHQFYQFYQSNGMAP